MDSTKREAIEAIAPKKSRLASAEAALSRPFSQLPNLKPSLQEFTSSGDHREFGGTRSESWAWRCH